MPIGNEVFSFNRAIVRSPARSVVNGLSSVASHPSFEGMKREHAAYVAALGEAGVAIDTLPPLDTYPDSVFVEDTALVFTQGAIVLRPGAPSRAGEAAEIAPTLARCFDRVLHLEGGFVDGGDVLTTAGVVFVGLSARTDGEGAKTLIALLRALGIGGMLTTTPPGVLHLKSDCSLLDADTILATPRLASGGAFSKFRLITTAPGEEGAANAVRVNDRILMSDAFPRTAEVVSRAGYKIVQLPTQEIAKLDAGLSCMSLRWRA